MKIEIVNKRKFVKMILLIIGIALTLITICWNNSYSKGEIRYKEIYVYSGDTLWNIAKRELNDNEYYKEEDIREVIYNLKMINNIGENTYLEVGQKLKIPTF